jgi:sugar lactone lactonase YvrE
MTVEKVAMSRFARAFFLFACAAALPADGGAQNPMARMADVRREIVAGNADRALRMLDSIAAVLPDHPNVPYLRAHALGRAGRMTEAAAEIRRLLRRDARYAQLALRDSTVIGLRPDFPAVDSLAAVASQPFIAAEVWASIAERDLVAEGTAYDPATRSVLVGSLNKHKIVAIAPDGSVTDRVAAGVGGLRSVVGIHVDTARGLLWAASNARYDTPADSTPSALFAFDARTGAFRARLPVQGAGPHFLNDVVSAADGTVYVTDTQAGRVWRAQRGDSALKGFAAVGPLLAPNGITISSDGRVLFVADVDHVRGHDLSRGETWRIAVPDTFGVSGIDGLAFVDGALIAHHPLGFWRVARYPLDATRRRIVGRSLIEANTPDGRTSTTGEVVGDDYVFIGNSQIDRMNLRTIDAATMEPIRIYRAPIVRGP